MGSNDVDQALISFFSGREIVFWVRESIIQVQVVYIDRNALKARISPPNWTKPLIIEHGLAEAKITCVEHRAHLSFEQEHHGAWAVEGIH